jgi:hypothetical protein
MAANPGMKEPKGKVFVPMASNRVATIAYTRPAAQTTKSSRHRPAIRYLSWRAEMAPTQPRLRNSTVYCQTRSLVQVVRSRYLTNK